MLPIVELEDAVIPLTGDKDFPRLSWAIMPAEHWAIVGPNGSGKSTLARALAGGAAVLSGRIAYPLAGLSHAEDGYVRSISLDDQRSVLSRFSRYMQGRYESLEGDDAPTAAAHLGLPSLDGAAGSEGGDGIVDIIDRLGLHHALSRKVIHLSNGEMRKLLILEALVGRPKLLIVDEPFMGFDRQSRTGLSTLLYEAAQRGVTLLLVTSRESEVPAWIENMMRVEDGRITRQARGGGASPRGVPLESPLSRTLGSDLSHRRQAGRSLVELRDVTVRYGGVMVLDGVSWTVKQGENWALVGPNGAGKTTLLSLVLADNPQAYANDVRVFGHRRGDGVSIWEIKRRIGHVSPEMQIHFAAEATVCEAICTGFFDSLRLQKACPPGRMKKARALAEGLGLQDVLDKPFAEVSEGQKRLALIARALVKQPRLLVFDEPFQGLDDDNRAHLREAIDGLCRTPAHSILFVTHEPEDIPSCVTHVLHLERGRVVSKRSEG